MSSLYTLGIEYAYSFLSRCSRYTAWEHFSNMQRNQWLSRKELEILKWKKLQRLLVHAYENKPFYRDCWKQHSVDPRRFACIDDLSALPVVDKTVLSHAREQDGFLLSAAESRYETAHTSGTTGQRFQVPFTLDCFQKKYAGHLRQVYACGWRLGIKSATLHYSGHTQFRGKYSGRSEDKEPFMGAREAALRIAHRRKVLTPYYKTLTGDENLLQDWYADLVNGTPYMFETMDYNLPLLQDFIERTSLPRPVIPKTYVLGTHSLSLRKRLEDFFSTELFDRYSPHEIEGVAFACHQHRGMHMAIDTYHVEFLDDANKPVGPGETGHIVITDLDNYLMPLVRYKIGDLGHYYEESCPCGRGLPLMGELDGRSRDQLRSEAGDALPPSVIAAVLQDEPAIVLFQVVQSVSGKVTASVIPKNSGLPDSAAAKIQQRLSALTGRPVTLRRVEQLPLEPNGKFSFVRRETV